MNNKEIKEHLAHATRYDDAIIAKSYTRTPHCIEYVFIHDGKWTEKQLLNMKKLINSDPYFQDYILGFGKFGNELFVQVYEKTRYKEE